MKKDSVKTPQSTIADAKIPTQTFRWQRNFREQFRIKGVRKINNDALEYLAEIMLEWARHSKNTVDFKEFLDYQDTLREDMIPWEKRCPKLERAVQLTLRRLACNRERLSLFKKIDYKTMRHMQGVYDPQWKTQERYFNELKIAAASNAITPEAFKLITEKVLGITLPKDVTKDK